MALEGWGVPSRDPETAAEWKEAANAARFLLDLAAARRYGLVVGVEVKPDRCRNILHRATLLGKLTVASSHDLSGVEVPGYSFQVGDRIRANALGLRHSIVGYKNETRVGTVLMLLAPDKIRLRWDGVTTSKVIDPKYLERATEGG